MDLAFEDMHGSVLGLVFKFLWCSNDFIIYNAKTVFLASLRWLTKVRDVYLVQASSAFYWSAGFGTFLRVSALASHWLKDCENNKPTPEENDQYYKLQN